MAIVLDPATLGCTTDDDDRQAVAFVSHPLTDDRIQNWWPYCGPCVERFTDLDFRVVYLADHDPPAGHVADPAAGPVDLEVDGDGDHPDPASP